VVTIYKAIICHNPEDYSLKFNLCGYLKSNINCSIYSEESKVEVMLSLCLIMHQILKFTVTLDKPPHICTLGIA